MVTLPVRVELKTMVLLWNWVPDNTTLLLFNGMVAMPPVTRSSSVEFEFHGVSHTPTRSLRAGSSKPRFGVNVETIVFLSLSGADHGYPTDIRWHHILGSPAPGIAEGNAGDGSVDNASRRGYASG